MTNIRVDGNNGRAAGMANEGFGNSGGFIAINYGRTLVVSIWIPPLVLVHQGYGKRSIHK